MIDIHIKCPFSLRPLLRLPQGTEAFHPPVRPRLHKIRVLHSAQHGQEVFTTE